MRDAPGDSYYASDYKDIGTLKAIADQKGITILCVQHFRKQHDSDPHLMVSGSTGLTGAVDGSYVLPKKLNQYEHELEKIGIEFIKTRTGERREILLTYNPPDAFMMA